VSFGLRSQVAFSPHKDFLVRLPVDLPDITGTIGAVRLSARQPSPLAKQLVASIRGLSDAS